MSKTETVQFGPLPEKTFQGRPEAAWKASLRSRPGEWAWVKVKSTPSLSSADRAAGFEVVQRTMDGKRRIYCRWMDPS